MSRALFSTSFDRWMQIDSKILSKDMRVLLSWKGKTEGIIPKSSTNFINDGVFTDAH